MQQVSECDRSLSLPLSLTDNRLPVLPRPVTTNRLIGAIYDDKHEYEKAEPFLQNSYQVAKRLRDNDEDR